MEKEEVLKQVKENQKNMTLNQLVRYMENLRKKGYDVHMKNRVGMIELVVDNVYIVQNPRIIILQDEKGDKIFY